METQLTTTGCPFSSDIDLLAPEYLADPYPHLERLREDTPVAYLPELKLYLVTRYADVSSVFQDRDTFASAGATSPFFPICPEAEAILSTGFPRKATLSNCDPPRHTQMRSAVAQCLTPRRWTRSQPAVRDYATALVQRLAGQPVADLFADLTYPLPAFAGFALLGFPPEDTDRIKEWCVYRVLLTYGKLEAPEQVKAARELTAFWSYVEAHVRKRMVEPADDLTTDLLDLSAKSPDTLTTEDVINMVYSIGLASHETSQNAMLNGLRRILADRPQWEALCADPALIPNAVEELLRFDAPAIGLRRHVTRDTEIGGLAIPKGATVMLMTGSANHDPAQFAEPKRLDIRRANARSHLSFGKQWHFCLGTPLARFEYHLVLQLLTSLTPRMRLVDKQQIRYLPILQFRGMDHLLVEPAPAA